MSAETNFADGRADAEVGDNLYDPHNLVTKRPQDVGLSPLGCGNCGQDAIMTHPCPNCDYAPGRDDDQHTLVEWSE